MNHFIVQLIKVLNQNKVFKFISSIRMAVPLMLGLAGIVAWGTVVESMYNSEYASLVVYKSGWFGALLILLWINIFSSTISRIPFKKHHTGFVITHIGLLILLIGGYITNSYGIDGQLIIPEKQTNSTVILPHVMVGYQLENQPQPQKINFKKTVTEKNKSALESVNNQVQNLFSVESYLPFAKVTKSFESNIESGSEAIALSFILKSNFFNVNEWLHTEINPQMSLGPATLKIIKTNNLDEVPFKNMTQTKSSSATLTPKKSSPVLKTSEKKSLPPKQKAVPNQDAIGEKAILTISDVQNNKVKEVRVEDLKKGPLKIKDVTVKLNQYFTRAIVSANKMTEGGPDQEPNPAMELSIEKGNEKKREILYAKFAGFSLNPGGAFGLKFSFNDSSVLAKPSSAHSAGTATDENQNRNTKELPAGHPNLAESSKKTASSLEDDSSGSTSSGANQSESNSSIAKSESESAQSTSGNMGHPPMAVDNDSINNANFGKNNTILFSIDPKVPGKARVTLIKNQQVVSSEILTEGQNIETPWMGMKIFIAGIVTSATEKIIATPVQPEKGMPLPPSAILIQPKEAGSKAFWLSEDEQKSLSLLGKSSVIYYGRQTFELPFDLTLEKFTKKDYPGTQTPMSFESLVQIGKTGVTQKIAMNEPMKHEGYTIYQASYSIQPGQTLSIFSVNQDPGRSLKYIGSLILSLGIILITLMRSNFWKKKFGSAN